MLMIIMLLLLMMMMRMLGQSDQHQQRQRSRRPACHSSVTASHSTLQVAQYATSPLRCTVLRYKFPQVKSSTASPLLVFVDSAALHSMLKVHYYYYYYYTSLVTALHCATATSPEQNTVVHFTTAATELRDISRQAAVAPCHWHVLHMCASDTGVLRYYSTGVLVYLHTSILAY